LIRTDDELQELRDTRAKVAQAAQAAAPIQAGAQKFAETAGERLAQG
jgi:hypothetical protein